MVASDLLPAVAFQLKTGKHEHAPVGDLQTEAHSKYLIYNRAAAESVGDGHEEEEEEWGAEGLRGGGSVFLKKNGGLSPSDLTGCRPAI